MPGLDAPSVISPALPPSLPILALSEVRRRMVVQLFCTACVVRVDGLRH